MSDMSRPAAHVTVPRLLLATTVVLACGLASASTRIAGNVWKVDPDTSSVTILDAGRKITFTYDADTIVRHGSTDRAIGDLHRGDRVVVTLADEIPDALHARLIAIAGPQPSPRHHPTPTPQMP